MTAEQLLNLIAEYNEADRFTLAVTSPSGAVSTWQFLDRHAKDTKKGLTAKEITSKQDA